MRLRRRALIAAVLLAIFVIACTLFNLEGMRATYFAEQAESCGALAFGVGGLLNTTDEAQRAADCFTRAASGCRAAVLTAGITNTDSGGSYWFLVETPLSPLGACEIAARWDGRSIHASSGGVAACQSVARQPGALRFRGCGPQGDISLPITHGSYLAWRCVGRASSAPSASDGCRSAASHGPRGSPLRRSRGRRRGRR